MYPEYNDRRRNLTPKEELESKLYDLREEITTFPTVKRYAELLGEMKSCEIALQKIEIEYYETKLKAEQEKLQNLLEVK